MNNRSNQRHHQTQHQPQQPQPMIKSFSINSNPKGNFTNLQDSLNLSSIQRTTSEIYPGGPMQDNLQHSSRRGSRNSRKVTFNELTKIKVIPHAVVENPNANTNNNNNNNVQNRIANFENHNSKPFMVRQITPRNIISISNNNKNNNNNNILIPYETKRTRNHTDNHMVDASKYVNDGSSRPSEINMMNLKKIRF